MVTRFDNDHVSHEIGSEAELESLDDIFSFGFSSREVEHGELLVGSKEDEVRAKDDSLLLELVVVELDGGVVRRLEGDDPGFVSLLDCVVLLVDDLAPGVDFWRDVGLP